MSQQLRYFCGENDPKSNLVIGGNLDKGYTPVYHLPTLSPETNHLASPSLRANAVKNRILRASCGSGSVLLGKHTRKASE